MKNKNTTKITFVSCTWSASVGERYCERPDVIGHYPVRHVHAVFVVLSHLSGVGWGTRALLNGFEERHEEVGVVV